MRVLSQEGRMKPRADGLTTMQRVWKWLKAHPGPQRCRDISQGVDIPENARSCACLRLGAAGFATSTGKGQATRWAAVGEVMPPDLRGYMPNSILNIQASHIRNRRVIATEKTDIKHFAWKGKPTTALEQAWGFGCERQPSQGDKPFTNSKSVLQYAGETTSVANTEPA